MATSVNQSQKGLNFTCADEDDVLCHITLWIHGLFWIWLVIGTIGNCLTLLVLPRKRMRKHSTTVYLIFLTISDLFMLWTSVFHKTTRAFYNVNLKEESEIWCVSLKWLLNVFSGFSVWLLVLVTVDRFILTTFPHSSGKILSARNATIASILTLVFLSLANIWSLFGFTWLGDHRNSRGRKCGFTSDSYKKFFMGPYNYLILFGYSVIPIALITVGNITIAAKLRRQSRRIQPSTTATRTASRNNSTTKMIVLVNLVFVVTTLPPFLFSLIKCESVEKLINDRRVYRIVQSLLNILLLSNFTFNFFLYCTSGSMFKQELKCMIQDVRRLLFSRFYKRSTIRRDGISTKGTSLDYPNSINAVGNTQRSTMTLD